MNPDSAYVALLMVSLLMILICIENLIKINVSNMYTSKHFIIYHVISILIVIPRYPFFSKLCPSELLNEGTVKNYFCQRMEPSLVRIFFLVLGHYNWPQKSPANCHFKQSRMLPLTCSVLPISINRMCTDWFWLAQLFIW